MAKKPKYGWAWAGAIAFSAGYLVIAFLKSDLAGRGPAAATAVAVIIAIVVARRSGHAVRGAMWGLGIGLSSSVGVALAMHAQQQELAAKYLERMGVTTASGPITSLPASLPTTAAATGRPPLGPIISPESLRQMAIFSALATSICCTAAGVLFGFLSRRRQATG